MCTISCTFFSLEPFGIPANISVVQCQNQSIYGFKAVDNVIIARHLKSEEEKPKTDEEEHSAATDAE